MGRSKKGMIIGVIVGVLAVIAAVSCILVFFVFNNKDESGDYDPAKGSPKKIAKQYLGIINDGKFYKIYDLTYPGAVDTEEVDAVQKSFRLLKETGVKYKIKLLNIVEEVKVDDALIPEIEANIKEARNMEIKVDEAKYITIKYELSASLDGKSESQTGKMVFSCIKVDGGWYLLTVDKES